MKDGLLSLLEKCRRDKNRAALAAAVGVLAMLLILISELFPQADKTVSSGRSRVRWRIRLSWSSVWKN